MLQITEDIARRWIEIEDAAREVLGPYSDDGDVPALPTIEGRLLLLVASAEAVDRKARQRGETPGHNVQEDLAALSARIGHLRKVMMRGRGNGSQ